MDVLKNSETIKKLCTGCQISYSDLKDQSNENILNFLYEHGVITNRMKCPVCERNIQLSSFGSAKFFRCSNRKVIKKTQIKKYCSFRRSLWSGTFFNGKISPFSVFRLVGAVLWLLPPRNKVFNPEANDDDNRTFFKHLILVNEVFIDSVSQNSKKLGGEGLHVELLEAKWKSDNLKGGVWDWVLGGIDRQSGETFLAPVENYNFESLKMMISEKINPGSIIITNCTSSFSEGELKDLNESLSVSFVHPAFSEISSLIKHHWSEVCKGFTSLSSKRPPHSVEQLAEYLFKSKHPVLTERMHAFFVAAADLWPPGIYSSPLLPFKKLQTQTTQQ